MPTDTPDQQITLPVDADTADNPVAFNQFVGDMEQRLVRTYTDIADRTARMLTVNENDISTLDTENRAEIYDGTNHISLHTRALYAYARKTADQNVGPSNTTLQNLTDLLASFPATVSGAIYGFRAVIFSDASTAADIKFAVTIPTGATMRWGLHSLMTTASAGSGDLTAVTATGSGTSASTGGSGTGTVTMTIIEGEMTMAANAGNLQLQAAQVTSDATATTVFTRSHLEVWRIS